MGRIKINYLISIVILIFLLSSCVNKKYLIKVNSKETGSFYYPKKMFIYFKKTAKINIKSINDPSFSYEERKKEIEKAKSYMNSSDDDDENEYIQYFYENFPRDYRLLTIYSELVASNIKYILEKFPRMVYQTKFENQKKNKSTKNKIMRKKFSKQIEFLEKQFDVKITFIKYFNDDKNKTLVNINDIKIRDILIAIPNIYNGGYSDISGYSTAYGEFYIPVKLQSYLSNYISTALNSIMDGNSTYKNLIINTTVEKSFYDKIGVLEAEMIVLNEYYAENQDDFGAMKSYIIYVNEVINKFFIDYIKVKQKIETEYVEKPNNFKVNFIKEALEPQIVELNNLIGINLPYNKLFVLNDDISDNTTSVLPDITHYPNIISSSQLVNDKWGNYDVTNLVDSNLVTSWVEGDKSDGIGEWIVIKLPEGSSQIQIANGYQKDENIFNENNRVKEISLYLFNASSQNTNDFHIYCENIINSESEENLVKIQKIILKDKLGYQNFEIDNQLNYQFLALKINSIYAGSKYKDTCISELSFNSLNN